MILTHSGSPVESQLRDADASQLSSAAHTGAAASTNMATKDHLVWHQMAWGCLQNGSRTPLKATRRALGLAVARSVGDALLLVRAFGIRTSDATASHIHHATACTALTGQSESGSSSPAPPTVALLFRKAKFMLYSMGRCQAVYLKNQSRKLCSAYACSQVHN